MVTHSLPISMGYPQENRKILGFEHAIAKQAAAETFMNALLELPSECEPRNPLEWACSVLLHFIVIASLIIAPLYFTDAINLKDFQNTWVAAPAPPGPPPPPAAAPQVQRAAPSVSRLIQGGRMMAPRVIPKKIAIIKEDPLPPEPAGGVIGGVPGGVPGGTLGGVLGGIIGGAASPMAAVAPPPPPVKRIVRVGGKVEPPKQTYAPELKYPAIARAAKVEGTVVIDAIIDEQGNVVQAHVVSGPGLLIGAALQSVQQWRYEPTRLNGEPVSVEMHVQVHFALQ
ncbi:MAG: energy transducer TonB [Candidatus Acidiferrales bacterium]